MRKRLEDKWSRNHAAFSCDDMVDPNGTWRKPEKAQPWQSSTFFDVTRQKAVAGQVLLKDIYFKGGNVPFMLIPGEYGTHINPEVVAQTRQILEADIENTLSQMPSQPNVGQEDAVVDPSVAVTDEDVERKVAEDNEKYIQKQMAACEALTQLELMIISGTVYGEYWGKIYNQQIEVGQEVDYIEGVLDVQPKMRKSRALEAKSVWNMFRDMEVEDSRDGRYIIERDYWSADQGYKLLDDDNFLNGGIMEALDVGAPDAASFEHRDNESPRKKDLEHQNRNMEYIEYYGMVPAKVIAKFQIENSDGLAETKARLHDVNDLADEVEVKADRNDYDENAKNTSRPDNVVDADARERELQREHDHYWCQVILLNGKVIRYNAIDITEIPYFHDVFEREIDGHGGRSICDNVEYAQTVLNGAIRNMEDNMKLCNKLIIAVMRRAFDGEFEEMFNNSDAVCVLDMAEEAATFGGARAALQQIRLDPIVNELERIISMFMEFADLSSFVPRIQQGADTQSPNTAFELNERLERSGKYMADVIKRFDRFVGRMINSFLDYNMRDPENDIPKGVFQIKVLGFDSFNNRVVRLQKLMQMLNMVSQDEELRRRTNMVWLLKEIAKALDIEQDQLVKQDAEMDKMEQLEARRDEEMHQAGMAKLDAELKEIEAEIRKTNADAEYSTARANAERIEAIAEAAESYRKSKSGRNGSEETEEQPTKKQE